MRRRESVTHHPPAALYALPAGPERTLFEDIYRHLFREGAGATTQVVNVTREVTGATGATWNDRGDPSEPDWDVLDLTEGSWQDLDLSSIVGAAERLVLLRVHTTGTIRFRTNGNTNEANVATINFDSFGGDSGGFGDLWVLTDSNGVIEYDLRSDTSIVSITVAGWWSW